MGTLVYNVRSVANRKVTSAAIVLSVMLAVFITAATSMLVRGIERLFVSQSRPESVIVLAKGTEQEFGSGVSAASLRLLLALPQVRRGADGTPLASAEIMQLLNLERSDGSGGTNVVLRGLDESGYRIRPRLKVTAGRLPKIGSDEAIVGSAIAGRVRGLDLGQELKFGKSASLKIVGVFTDGAQGVHSSTESEVIADSAFVQSAFGSEGIVSSVRLDLVSADAFDAFRAAAEERPIQLSAMRLQTFEQKQAGMLSTMVSVLGAVIGTLLTVAGVFGALVGMHGSISARTREFGTMRALGFSRGAILRGVLTEAILLATLGAVLGAGAALCLLPVRITMMGPNWASVVLQFQATPAAFVAATLNALLIGLFGASLPAVRALRIPPTAALRGG